MVATVTRKIVLSGYYGFRNSGDEAVLRSILTALETEGRLAGIAYEPIVLSADPAWTTRMYGVRAVPRMKLAEVRKAIRESHGLISGGGSLLQDATGPASIPYYLGIIKLAQWMRKPTFVYAQGVGPVNRKVFRPMIAWVFKRCRYISVRDMESAELLHSMGLRAERVEVVPDPVMGMKLPEEMGVALGEELSEGASSRSDNSDSQAAGRMEASGLPGSEPLSSDWSSSESPGSESPFSDSPGSEPVNSGLPGSEPLSSDWSSSESPGSESPFSDSPDSDPLPVVGISVRFWNSERAELTALSDGVAALARQHPVHLRFLPFHLPSDEEASRFCAERIGDLAGTGSKVSIAPATDNPQDMLREVDACSLLLGMRLHSLIYAASRSVPLLGISYDPKIDHFLARLGTVPIGTSDHLDPKSLAAQSAHLLASGEEWRRKHSGQIEKLKREAQLPARRITDFLNS